MKLSKLMTLLVVFAFCVYFLTINTARAQNGTTAIGERPTLEEHVNETDIENSAIKFKKLT